MSDQKDNGGPAFPTNGEQFVEGVHGIQPQSAYGMQGSTGMTLRDYFAAKAMQGMMASETEGNGLMHAMQGTEREQWILKNAIYSYVWADAMLKARNS